MGAQSEPELDEYRTVNRIGAYDIVAPISTDGIGVIYHARELSLNRSVSIKLLVPELAENDAARERFRNEAVSVARINHENVVKIHYVGVYEKAPYLVMEYLDGPTLEEKLKDGPLKPMDVVRIASSIALGLEAVHAGGVVHTDINPRNIVLERDRVVITNFGVVGLSVEKTESAILASPMFNSPEQVLGESVDFRTDLFSLGSVMYAMATGHSPFAAKTSNDVVNLIQRHEPKPLHEIRDEIPEFLSPVVARLLEKDPKRRDVTATDAAEACRSYIEMQTDTATVVFSGLERPQPKSLKRTIVAGLIAALLIVGGGFAIATYLGTARTDRDKSLTHDSQQPQTEASVAANLEPAKLPNPALERKTAEWVLRVGRTVEVLTDAGMRVKVSRGSPLPDGGFKILQIDLTRARSVDDFDIQRLKGLETLKLLNLRMTACTGLSIQHLTGIDTLLVLSLKSTDTDDTGLEFLAQMPNLKKINLVGTKLSDAGLSHVEELRGLVGLYLNDTQITDAAIEHFKNLKRLVVVELSDTQLTDVGLKQLAAEHPNLTNLYIYRTRVSDLSVPALKKLNRLVNLGISNTEISSDGVAQLKGALPDCVFH